MKRLEAICDAVAHVNGYGDPESRAYEMRNPGLLADDAGTRRFTCHRGGYAALLERVRKVCAGAPEGTLDILLQSLAITMRAQQEKAVDFMSRCANATITLQTPLHWFLE